LKGNGLEIKIICMINIREAVQEDAEGIAKTHVASWQSAYRGILEDEYLKALKWQDRVAKWQGLIGKKDETIFVALEQDEIVGFVSGGKSEEHGAELFSIYVLPQFQRRGIGEKLFHAFEGWVRQRGIDTFIVWVAKSSPYQAFYVKMNGKLTNLSKKQKFGNREIEIVAFLMIY
jgi:ribosomal protein S18 acetylase RimI-like enzyme